MHPLLIVLAAVVLFLVVTLATLVWVVSGQVIARRKPDVRTSPTDHGLPFEEVAFPARDGLTLRGWFIPAPQPRGAVVFCHGHAGSMDPDVQYAPWFHQAGFSVLMFDFRGHGRSDGQHVSLGALERQDLLGAVDELARRGFTRVGVLGFSMGGAVALLTAPLDERIAAVVSDGGFASVEGALVGWVDRHARPLRPLAHLLAPLVRRVAGWRLHTRLENPRDWVGRLAPRPLLLIHGDRDPYITVEAVEALYAAAGQPKELWRVAEADHREVDQHRPEAYRQRVMGFFEQYL